MRQWLKRLSEKWAGWISDPQLERSLRSHLSGRGFYGDSAKFITFRLVAIQRPGWLQVYSFVVRARIAKDSVDDAEYAQLFGLVRQDERYKKCDIQLFQNMQERHSLYQEWSTDLIRLRRPNL
jgi:hypothetical protein